MTQTDELIMIKLTPLIDELTGLMGGYTRYINALTNGEKMDYPIIEAYKDRMNQILAEMKAVMP